MCDDTDGDLHEQLAAHGGLVHPLDLEQLRTGYQGCYHSETAYLRQELEPFVDPCIHWLFDCLDWSLVRVHFGDLHTVPLQDGAVLVLRPEPSPAP